MTVILQYDSHMRGICHAFYNMTVILQSCTFVGWHIPVQYASMPQACALTCPECHVLWLSLCHVGHHIPAFALAFGEMAGGRSRNFPSLYDSHIGKSGGLCQCPVTATHPELMPLPWQRGTSPSRLSPTYMSIADLTRASDNQKDKPRSWLFFGLRPGYFCVIMSTGCGWCVPLARAY